MKQTFYAILSIALLLSTTSCNKDDDNENNDAAKTALISDYADLVSESYEKALEDAETLKTAIETFTADPTQANFDAAKDAWFDARESYGPTEAFRFAEGPIDLLNGVEGPEGLLNSWPLDENYIDYVDGSANAGIINDLTNYPTIDKDLLESLNGDGGEENVSVGYHAIEFLLWGQDLTAPSALEAGDRPYTDFVDGGTASNQDRRRAYLEICADLLTDHLQILVDEWASSGDYRATFLAMDQETVLSNIMTGIATLAKGELAGERMFVAYDNQDQEDEHSCFSDNTHRDIRLNFDGIKDVYLNGSNSLNSLIADVDATLAEEITTALTDAETAVYATGIPFDNAITDASERPAVLEAVQKLQTLGDKFVEGGVAIGITVRTE